MISDGRYFKKQHFCGDHFAFFGLDFTVMSNDIAVGAMMYYLNGKYEGTVTVKTLFSTLNIILKLNCHKNNVFIKPRATYTVRSVKLYIV